jgi:hypothetical protein
MKRLHCTRAQAFLLAILLLGTFGGLAFFYDGTPAKPEQSTSTIETKETP